MRNMRVFASGTALVLLLGACGGSSAPSKDAFVTAVDDICHTLDRAVVALGDPASLADVSSFADKASRAFEAALVSLKKLPVPSDKNAVSDAKDLLANLDQEVTLLDDISAAAKGSDTSAVTSKAAALGSLMKDSSKVAASLGAQRCAIDPLLVTQATTTTSTTTTTTPPTTVPETTPLTLVPPTTAPGATDTSTGSTGNGNDKLILPLAASMSKNAKYVYADAPKSITQNFITVLDMLPETASAPGKVGGVEVSDKNGTKFARVFLFVPTDPLGSDAMKNLTKTLVGTDPSQATVMSTVHGTVYHSASNGYFFIAGNPVSAPQVVVWAVAQDAAGLKIAVEAFISNVPA